MSLFFSSSHCTVYEVLVQVQSLRCMGGSLVLSERCKTERLYVYRYTGKNVLVLRCVLMGLIGWHYR